MNKIFYEAEKLHNELLSRRGSRIVDSDTVSKMEKAAHCYLTLVGTFLESDVSYSSLSELCHFVDNVAGSDFNQNVWYSSCVIEALSLRNQKPSLRELHNAYICYLSIRTTCLEYLLEKCIPSYDGKQVHHDATGVIIPCEGYAVNSALYKYYGV